MAVSTERQFSPVTSHESAQEAAIRSLLARANLLRMRGQWEEAIAVCTEALRQAPRSASAHSLLGDIYAGLGRIDDAAQWFSMAVDLAPTNATDRAKLHRALEAQRAARPAAPLAPPPIAVSAPPTAEKTLEWFDRVFPPGRSDSIARLIFVMCGGIAVLLLLSAGFVYLTLRHDNSTVSLDEPPLPSPLSVTGSAALTVPVVMTPSSLRSTPPSPKPIAAPVAVFVATPPPAPTSVSGLSDSVLRSRLAALLPAGITLVSAAGGDSTSGTMVSLAIAVPATVSRTIADTPDLGLRERVVRAAAAASRAVVSLLPRAAVHVVVLAQNGAETANTTVAFTADAASGTFRDLDPATASLLDLLSRFRSIQWGSDLLPNSDKNEKTDKADAMGKAPGTLAVETVASPAPRGTNGSGTE